MNLPTNGERYPVLDYGHVIYVDHMGDDADIVDAARVSYQREGKSSDRDLLRYLMRHRHTSPFEMCELKIVVKCPIFVARQWVRHRTASMNEVSARYTRLPQEQFFPAEFPIQSSDNKQGRNDDALHPQQSFSIDIAWRKARDYANDAYDAMLKKGVAREIARCVLPLSTYTEFVWKIDLHNLMHFLALRLDPHAQEEIRVYADRINEIAWRLWPTTMEAFHDYVVSGSSFSKYEIAAIRSLIGYNIDDRRITDLRNTMGSRMTDREFNEFVTKIGLDGRINPKEGTR